MMQLLKYAENKSYDNAIMSHLFSEISLYICCLWTYYDVNLSLLEGQLVRNLYKYNNVVIRSNARSKTRSNLSLNK